MNPNTPMIEAVLSCYNSLLPLGHMQLLTVVGTCIFGSESITKFCNYSGDFPSRAIAARGQVPAGRGER